MKNVDVVIIGASAAGCTAALSFAKAGRSVLLLDKVKAKDKYKQLCTHFIQSSTLPVIRKLGLDDKLHQAGATRSIGAFYTSAGWVNPDGRFDDSGQYCYSYAVERRILDPLLKSEVEANALIELKIGATFVDVKKDPSGHFTVDFEVDEEMESVSCLLPVAADGRQSTVARVLENPKEETPNDRAVCMAYFEGIARPENDRSLFYFLNQNTGFVYPLADGRTLLSVCIHKDLERQWRKDGAIESLMAYFRAFPDMPDMTNAQCVSRLYGYRDYPNQTRQVVWQGIPFIGDASLSLDAMAGVGIGFAMVSADLLASEVADELDDVAKRDAALKRFAKRHVQVFASHIKGIKADALIAKSDGTVKQFYEQVKSSRRMEQAFVALTERVISPEQFQVEYLKSIAAQRQPVFV